MFPRSECTLLLSVWVPLAIGDKWCHFNEVLLSPAAPVIQKKEVSTESENSHSLQAPLLAYNHFVEAVFVLNECRPGLAASGSEGDPISLTQVGGPPASQGACRLTGADEATRAKRDTIYR